MRSQQLTLHAERLERMARDIESEDLFLSRQSFRFGEWREVRGAQQRGRAGGSRREDQLLPRLPGAMREPWPRLEHLIAVRRELGQARGELAGPALDPAQLGASGGAGVDGDAMTGQQA